MPRVHTIIFQNSLWNLMKKNYIDVFIAFMNINLKNIRRMNKKLYLIGIKIVKNIIRIQKLY